MCAPIFYLIALLFCLFSTQFLRVFFLLSKIAVVKVFFSVPFDCTFYWAREFFSFDKRTFFDLQKRREGEKKTKLKVGIKCVHKSKFMFGFVIISNLFVITIKSDRNMQFFLSFCSVFCRFRSSPNAPHTAMAPVCWCCMYFAHETQLEFYGKLFCQNGFIQIFMCFLVLFISRVNEKLRAHKTKKNRIR